MVSSFQEQLDRVWHVQFLSGGVAHKQLGAAKANIQLRRFTNFRLDSIRVMALDVAPIFFLIARVDGSLLGA